MESFFKQLNPLAGLGDARSDILKVFVMKMSTEIIKKKQCPVFISSKRLPLMIRI